MKIRYAVLASVVAASGTAYGQNYNNSIGVDVTPQAQVERNREDDKKVAEARRMAEAQAAQARQRAAELQRARIQAEAAREAARIQAQGEIEAAKNRKPDVCLNCNLWR
jgi:hypothetical protein